MTIGRETLCSTVLPFLHFVDNDSINQQGNADRLRKLRPVIQMIEERFASLYHPNRECAIDEAMVPYKGRSSLKQYMPKKPIRRGLKVWMRADSITGYISQFQIYVGKETSTERGLGARVIKDLTRNLVLKNYHIFCDKFFTSIKLFQELYQERVYATGTLRADRRGFPPDLTVCVWQDTRPVTACSTFCQSVPMDEVQRKNKYMGGVDRNDQLREYYHVRLKSRKYYKYLFWMLFDVGITNALIISRYNPNLNSDTRNVKSFRVALAHQLMEGYCSRKTRGRRPTVIHTKRFRGEHFPLLGDGKQHRCHFCYLQGIRKDTKWYCKECDLYLCHKGCNTECFYVYHNNYV